MNPIRWAFVALAVLTLLAAPLVARGCHADTARPLSADTSHPAPAETRHTDRAASAETDARALLDQADADAEQIARLEAGIEAARGAEQRARAETAAARARTNILITAPTRTVRDTVLVDAPPGDLPERLAERIVTERVAADRALDACAVRADTAEALAVVQASRAVWAYAAADSALAALSYQRLAYVEADARATTATRLVRRRTRQRNALAGITAVLAGCAAIAILR